LKEIRSEIELHSSVSTAWKILTDFSTFHVWNPVIIQIIGEACLGEKLKISVRTKKGKTRIYRPTITKLEENHELRWKGKSFIPGFLNGERIFIFQQTSRDYIRLLHSELFSGFGTIIAGHRLIEDVESSLQQMNNAFKKRVEYET
jgi:hypothetical protein